MNSVMEFLRILVGFGILILSSAASSNETKKIISELSYKHNVLFGVGTSAAQIEGAWNTSGKGESTWDHYAHNPLNTIADHSTPDIATDSYHRLDRDIEMIKNLNVQMYRFSIAWTRVLPSGFTNIVNQDGLNYYHRLIDALLKNNIIPVITMYHWDLPQTIQELGGWANELTIGFFEDYAKVLFDNFADKVEIWITFNEIDAVCHKIGVDRLTADRILYGIGDYMCYRNVHLAHARVYHLYKNKYDTKGVGMMGLSHTMNWFEPKSQSPKDIAAAEHARAVLYGLQAHPIHSSTGDFPQNFKQIVANKSKDQGFTRSRLPTFTIEEIEYIRQTYDFFGMNYYTTKLVSHLDDDGVRGPSFEDDLQVEITNSAEFVQTEIDWIKNYPEGLRKSLNYVREHFENPLIIITENGCGTKRDTTNNTECVDYFQGHLRAVYDAVTIDHCKIRAYNAWCLMDNFEWNDGYTMKFGLYHTNFTDMSTRPKATALWYKEMMDNVKKETHLHPSAELSRGRLDSRGSVLLVSGIILMTILL